MRTMPEQELMDLEKAAIKALDDAIDQVNTLLYGRRVVDMLIGCMERKEGRDGREKGTDRG